MNTNNDAVGIILSQATTKEALCQLFVEAEKGGVREGMLLLIQTDNQNRKLLARVAEIIPYNSFYTEGDPWSEARRNQLPLPEDVARQYESCKLDLLMEIPGAEEIKIPPHPGNYAYRYDPVGHEEELFGKSRGDAGIIWYGTQVGYSEAPIPLNIENIPMHMAVFGVTGSGK